MSDPNVFEELIDDALRILVSEAHNAKVVLNSSKCRASLQRVADHLALEDRMAPELLMPRAERRREVLRAADRLEATARRGRSWGGRITLSERAADDIRIFLPSFSTGDLNLRSAQHAEALAAQLRWAVSQLDAKGGDGRSRGFYGSAEGRRQGDVALHLAAADLLDLLNSARGCSPGAAQPASEDGPWHQLVKLVAEAAGRPGRGGDENRRATLEAVRRALIKEKKPSPREPG